MLSSALPDGFPRSCSTNMRKPPIDFLKSIDARQYIRSALPTIQSRYGHGNYLRHLARIALEITYLPEAIGERLRKEDLASRDIFLILENDYGIALGRADLQIDAMLSDAGLARALRIEEGTALLRMERLTHTAEGAPLDFEYLYFRGDAFQYRLQIARHAATISPTTENHHANPYPNR